VSINCIEKITKNICVKRMKENKIETTKGGNKIRKG
jgi:hypothetical protein